MVSLYDYLLSNPDICKNGFIKAGIAEAITDPESISSLMTETITDPFEDCDSDLNFDVGNHFFVVFWLICLVMYQHKTYEFKLHEFNGV